MHATKTESPILDLEEAMNFCGFKNREAFKAWRIEVHCPCEIRKKAIVFHREVLDGFLRKLQSQRYYVTKESK